MLPALSGSNLIYGMGMLEMGMTMSYEQLLIDAEIVRMVRRVMKGITVNKDTFAEDVIKSVGAGGTYLAQKHTRKYMRQESSTANLIDRRMYDGWMKSGGKDIRERANEMAQKIVKEHKPEPLPESVSKEIHNIIEEAEDKLQLR